MQRHPTLGIGRYWFAKNEEYQREAASDYRPTHRGKKWRCKILAAMGDSEHRASIKPQVIGSDSTQAVLLFRAWGQALRELLPGSGFSPR